MDSHIQLDEETYLIDSKSLCDDFGKRFLLLNPIDGRAISFDAIADNCRDAYLSKEFTNAKVQFHNMPRHRRKIRDNTISSPKQFALLSIIPNHRCNFNCSYCYSAGTRNKEKVSIADIKTCASFILDNIASDTKSEQCFYCSFGGGGEPFLDWPLIKETISFTEKEAGKRGIKTEYSFTSNGSLICVEQAEFLASRNVKAVISFEILEDVQNTQRSEYEAVVQGINTLLQYGIPTTLISTITPENVIRQEEMILSLSRCFPQIRRLSFEPVVSADLFHDSPQELRDFFMRYTHHFLKAEQLALEHGITLRSSIRNKTIYLRKKSCIGGFNLTADGITFCPMVSHHRDKRFPSFSFARISDSRLIFDIEKIVNWPPPPPKKFPCSSCFAKWNCGGLCPVAWSVYSQDMQNEYCFFIKYFTLYALRIFMNEE